MIAALPSPPASSLPAALNHAVSTPPGTGAANSNTIDPTQIDPAQLNNAISQHFNNPQHQNTTLPSHVEAFYTMGHDPVPEGPPPVSTSPSMSLESSNLFEDLPRYLQEIGGPTNAAAMLAAQVQVTQATLNWTLYGQMASKAVSGIQSLFNNQV